MRMKIIAGNLVVVLLLGVVSFFVVRGQLATGLVAGVEENLGDDATLLARSWRLSGRVFLDLVVEQAQSQGVRDAFGGLDSTRRRERAHRRSNEIAAWFSDPARGRRGAPDIVVITDETGATVARNLDLNRTLPLRQLATLRQVLQDGRPRVDVWLYEEERKVLQMGIARIDSEEGAPLGALVVGYVVSDGFASAEAEVLGRDVAFITADSVYATSLTRSERDELRSALFEKHGESTTAALEADGPRSVFHEEIQGNDWVAVVAPLPDSSSLPVAYAVLANETELAGLANVANLLLMTTLLGCLFVLVYGWIIGNSFLKPLETIEEGVLAVMNGRTDLRIDVESAEFGGLAYRINQLINVFTGVEEEDAEGRVSSMPGNPAAGGWRGGGGEEAEPAAAPPPAAPAAGEGAGSNAAVDDPAVAAQLAAEPEDAYYARLFEEYVAAKTSVGENVSNIPKERFIERLEKNAQALTKKHGCREVRFQVEKAGNQVKLRPVLIR